MTTYRIGEAGATVFDAEGKPVARLRPGSIVVEGLLKNPDSLAGQHQRLIDRPNMRKRLGTYADKRVRPEEDKNGA